jgi:hypothetical protein
MLGYVPAYSVEEATGNPTLHQSGHMESGLRHEVTVDSNSTNIPVCSESKAQDLHSILAKILDSFIEIQNVGKNILPSSLLGTFILSKQIQKKRIG